MELSIIATGASLKGKDLTKIPKPIMAINYAFKYVDYDYLAAFDDPKVHGFPVDDRLHTNYDWVHKYKLDCHGWNRKARSHYLIMDSSDEIFGRSGSLFCGINVAFKLGYTKLNIYGADMELTNGFCHFYDKTPVASKHLKEHYERSFVRHQKTKNVFLMQIEDTDLEINFVSL